MRGAGRKYRFSWAFLGDVRTGRPNLGPLARVEVYRLMQFTFRDVLEEEFGAEKTDKLFFSAGFLAGKEFYKHALGSPADTTGFIKKLQDTLAEMKIGILRIEKSDAELGSFVMTVSEDLDCSGLPETGFGVCSYDEGFIAGLLEAFSGQPHTVKEIDCWCTGDRTCRFTVTKNTL